jgi:plasmid stabilization system protein ParE
MKIVIREKAADDLDGIFDWIAKDNPHAAIRIVRRLRDRIERLGETGLAHMGRSGLIEGTRELVEPPYIIVYTADVPGDTLTILAIFHGAQNR